jgi:hypothetical protein
VAAVSGSFVERRDERRRAAERRAEDLAIATDLLIRHVAPVDDLLRALEGSGCNKRLANALRSELAARRGR